MRTKTLPVAALCAATVLAVLGTAGGFPAGAAVPGAGGDADFNGDGYADAAVGVFDGTVNGLRSAGYVHVLFGGPDGLGSGGTLKLSQNSAGVPGTSEKNDRFGLAVATADLDGDGLSDLAVGAPGETVGDGSAGARQGSVTALYGSPGGFVRGKTVAQGGRGSAGTGASLAVGDFTRDGRTDLAIGQSNGESGKVALRPGPLSEDKPLLPVLDNGYGGTAGQLATGDFDGDGADELAVSAYGLESSGTRLLRWNAAGATLDTYWSSSAAGYSLAAGDFDGDRVDDLAIGQCRVIGHESSGDCGPAGPAKGGNVHVEYGGEGGGRPFGHRSQTFGQDTTGVPGTAEDRDNFGVELKAGRFNGDALDDLVIGAPDEAIGTRTQAGSVTVLIAGSGGLLDERGSARGTAVHQNTANVPGTAEANDLFGAAFTIGDYDKDGFRDLAVGSYGENGATSGGSGGVWYLRGNGTAAPTWAGSAALTPPKLRLTGAVGYGRVLGL
ncbi:integrin-like protein [Streptomyces sp. NPDC091292]|uniref:integrin-like protein n=1 Tax=Streptomyces sp. NPDC091292 TaxID=3365991 RepID=UPI003812B651